MSRVTKWKLEKPKVKVVFRLHFHATHIPQSGWEKLFISFIPTESGKTTLKTSKANVRNGACKWADPIYETTRLVLDSKTKQYDDKLYKLVVGMGTSRSSILGEAVINLADYADALQPSTIALPLHGSDHGTLLHVTVQLLTAKTGFREFEQQRDKGLQSGNNPNKDNEANTAKSSSSELQIPNDQVNKAKTQILVRAQSKELTSVMEEAGIHEEYSDSQVTYDGSSNASETYYIDKHDSSSTHEKGDGSDPHNDLAIAYEENQRLKGSLEMAESSINELKLELSVLQNHANEMSTETQKFVQELATEIASSQELAKEVTVLKSECSKFKNDLEQLKEMKSSTKLKRMEQSEHHKQLKWVNGVLVVEDRIRELQEKIYIGFHDSDLSFLQSDLELLLSTVLDLKKETTEALPLRHEALDVNMYDPETMLHFSKVPILPLQDSVPDSLERTNLELLSQLDIAKADRESLVRKMDQMECYYEALVQELEENQKRMLGEFQSLRNEHLACSYTISTCKAETESIRHDMNERLLKFDEERRDLGLVNKELERRAITSESALKRARLNYSIAVSQLQKDLDMLSFQVLSMFETNQNVIKEAFYPDLVENHQESDNSLVSNLRGDPLSDDLKKSLNLQENLYKKVEEELCEMCHANLYLDVYSGTLKETLLEASEDIIKMKEKLQEFAQQTQLSNQSRDALFTRLQSAVEDVHALNAQNEYYVAKCNDLRLQNQMLEANLSSVSKENFLLMEKMTECEALVMEYRVYKRKYEVVSSEKLELEKLLELQVSDNQNLQKDLEKERDVVALEVDDMKMKFKQGLHDLVSKLDTPNSCIEKLQLQIESVANKYKTSFESEERHVKNGEVLLAYLSSLELELQKISSEDKNFVEQIKGLDKMADEFEKNKLIISELKQENSRVLQLLSQHEESLEKLHKDRSVDVSLECELAEMQESMVCEDLKLTFVKTQYETRIEELVKQLRVSDEQCRELEKKHLDKEARLNQCLASEAHYVKENKELMVSLKSLRMELEASVDSINVLTKELEQYRELETKLVDTEAKLNHSLENEARYVEENEDLATTCESVRLELEASIAHNAEISESLEQLKGKVGMLEISLTDANNQHALEVVQLKDMLDKSQSDVEHNRELQMKLDDTEARLNDCLENEACYIKENEILATTLESVRLELKASIAYNVEISESNNVREISLTEVTNQHAVELGQLKDMLAKSESEVVQYKELQMQLLETEARLNGCLENEARYIKENEKLAMALESLRLELEDSIAKKAEISELNNVLEQYKDKVGMLESSLTQVNNQHDVEVGQLKDMLAKSESEVVQYKELQMKLDDTEARLNHFLENEACYIEEIEKLTKTLESVRLELEASIAHNAEISKSNSVLESSLIEVNNQHAVELCQLKEKLAKIEAEVVQYKELQTKLLDTEVRLNHCLESEARFIEENEKLLTTLEAVRLELEASIAHNAEISESNNVLEQYKDMLAKSQSEVGQYRELRSKLLDTEARLNDCLENEVHYIQENEKLSTALHSLRADLEASIAKNAKNSDSNDVLEQWKEESEIVWIVLKGKLDEQKDELTMLRNKCSELTNKLSEQIMKTEEFKNLSIYLKELKDNADVAREKRDPEGPSESLRMAFIKEQYQTKVQELKQQLSVSKRHSEELLFKLQDALDETESRKKSEASQLKRIEELEAELQLVASEKPDYDRIQAELECALLSLECCKEEKEKLVASLQECEEEKSRIAVEVSLIKEQLAQKEENGSVDDKEVEHAQSVRGVSECEGVEHESAESKQLTVVNDQFRAQHLRSYMDQLDQELEKMKNDNSLLPLTNYDPSFQDLQGELSQLSKANEELARIYPNFIDFSGNGNALERVLALEIELAEALRAKKKSSIQFQSSFLKQHSDEEAVFKSFRDINELIKDMLEVKGKYVNVETELKEMHDRYSQLSLQFAEVEGERQKLMMTLKNVRSSRNMLRLNRSSSATLEEHPL